MDASYEEVVNNVLGMMGLKETETNREQVAIFMQAMEIFQDRNEKYGDLWKEFGWRGNLMHVHSKAARVRKVWWDGDPNVNQSNDLDDAYDLLNYTVFFIRNVEAGNELGTA